MSGPVTDERLALWAVAMAAHPRHGVCMVEAHEVLTLVRELQSRRAAPADRDAMIEECAAVAENEAEGAKVHNPDTAHTKGANAYAAATAYLAIKSCAEAIRSLKTKAIP